MLVLGRETASILARSLAILAPALLAQRCRSQKHAFAGKQLTSLVVGKQTQGGAVALLVARSCHADAMYVMIFVIRASVGTVRRRLQPSVSVARYLEPRSVKKWRLMLLL